MEIFVFLLGLGLLVLVIWAMPAAVRSATIALFGKLVADRKYRRQNRPQGRSPSLPPESKQQTASKLPSVATVQPQQLHSGEVQLPKALGILRKMNPYAFEELLLTCCHKQGWEIERNFRYTGDGGLDGRVIIVGKLYLIQAKRYRGYINPKHIHDFNQVIQREKAYGGFFIHSGKTGELAKELLRKYQISLISGQRLVNFVLGLKLKVLEKVSSACSENNK